MTNEPSSPEDLTRAPSRERKPPWIRVKLPSGETYDHIKRLMRSKLLHTVCEEAMCPNVAECWGCGTATFLILGDVCTRNCSFCAVKKGRPNSDPDNQKESLEVAAAALAMQLRHAVVTSVTRDDLPDGGATVFAETIRQIHDSVEDCTVEVLIPDLKGDLSSLSIITAAKPEILGHNMETVARLYHDVRRHASYERSLTVLRNARRLNESVITKSGIMVGLGESSDELLQVMHDLREVDCDVLTIGQYLRPTSAHHPVFRYYSPDEFMNLKEIALAVGFRWVESGPLVRSSYHADVQARALRQS